MRALIFTLITIAMASAVADAEIISASAVFEIIDPPASVQQNALESNSRIRVFKEQTNFVSEFPFRINGTGPKVFNDFGDYSDRVMPIGTRFDSYFVHVDTVGSASRSFGPGRLTFSRPIIGIVGRDPDIIASSALFGAIDTNYPLNRNNQHFDFSNNDDSFTLFGDGRSIQIQAEAGGQQDQLRILVESVPEPFGKIWLGWCIWLILHSNGRRKLTR